MNGDLFANQPRIERLGPGTVLLQAFAADEALAIWGEIQRVVQQAPWRRMWTPGGRPLSVAMSNCGDCGWISDAAGYRYVASDPQSGQPWPAMPEIFRHLARRAADAAGFPNFAPDACLINRYEPGAKMALHQDRDERDLTAPIVSLSLGLPATFLLGGMARSDKALRLRLGHGDMLVWGGPDRLRFHGVAPVGEGDHPVLGRQRINLTFRRAN